MTQLPLADGIRRRVVEIPGGPLAVLEVPGDGTPVLLVPGYTGSKEDFREILVPLAATGRRVLAYDQRGQYESPGPDDVTAYGVEQLAADLLALLDALELEPVHLVGHSFGGLVARSAVLKSPERVRSLTLMSSGPDALTGPRVDVLPLLEPVLEQGGIVALADAADALSANDPRTLAQAPELRQFLRARMLASAPGAYLGMAAALTSEPDLVAELRATGVPTFVLYGEADDAWAPALQAEMAERLGAARAVVPDALHSPAVENPDETVRVMSAFLDQVEGR